MRRSTARDRLCLPRTPYLLTTLNFSYGDRSALIVTMSVLISVLETLKGLLRHVPRSTSRSRTPASTAGAATVPAATAAPGERGPLPLGMAVTRMGRLANGRRDREARGSHRLASPELPRILDMEESPTPSATTRRRRHSRFDSDDVSAESGVGNGFTASS